MWDGIERREVKKTDHDLLQQIANDIEHIKRWTEKHEKLDDNRYLEQQNQNKSYNRIIWLGGGVLIAFQTIITFIK